MALIRIKGRWWVNLRTNDGKSGQIYQFDNKWKYQNQITTPPNADPISMVTFNDRVLVSDMANFKIYQYDYNGKQLADFKNRTLNALLRKLKHKRKRYNYLGFSMMVLFGLSVIILFVYALKHRDS